jgi:hypothetical protein
MPELFHDLEFIGWDFTWAPSVTGNKLIDHSYGFECAYRYYYVGRLGTFDPTRIRSNAYILNLALLKDYLKRIIFSKVK